MFSIDVRCGTCDLLLGSVHADGKELDIEANNVHLIEPETLEFEADETIEDEEEVVPVKEATEVVNVAPKSNVEGIKETSYPTEAVKEQRPQESESLLSTRNLTIAGVVLGGIALAGIAFFGFRSNKGRQTRGK